MYISELAIHGFKSFANKERLSFGEGVTAVVGPNGCGKTNIVDAVRWVLGEQKTRMLRSARLNDIIFNGSDAKKPLSVCEVSLTVHNNRGMLPVEYDDVEITRRIFRNGESEYMINRNSCRLKDIHNLFVDTGMGADAYSVIELKMIEDILSENADDRRRMFEEAAGINKYRQQRRATLLKLDSTKGDLDRVNDIINEVEKKVQGLQLQMKRYKRHAKIIDKVKEKEINLASIKNQNIYNELDPLRKKVASFSDQRNSDLNKEKGREEVLEKLRSMYEKQRAELSSIQIEIDSLSKQRQASSNQSLVLNEQKRGSEETIARLKMEKVEGGRKKEAHFKKIEELNLDSDILAPNIDSVKADYESLKTDYEKNECSYADSMKLLDSMSIEHFEQLKKLNETRSLSKRTEEYLDEKSIILNALEKRSSDYDSKNNELRVEQKSHIAKREEYQVLVDEKKKKLDLGESTFDKLRIEKNENTIEYHSIINRVETLESQLQFYREVVEKNEGYPSGTRYVLHHLDKFNTVLGTVADIIDVKEESQLAIEAALGPVSKSLVCKKREDALKIVQEVSEKNLGRICIIPLDSIPSPNNSKNIFSEELDASRVVSCNSQYNNMVEFFLKGIPIVENSVEAEEYFKNNDFIGNAVDIKGNLYTSSGMIMSHENNSTTGILGRKEKIESLDKEIGKLVKKSEKVKILIEKAEKKLGEIERDNERLSLSVQKTLDSLIKIENEITRIEYGISKNLEIQQSTTREVSSVKSDLLNYKKSLDSIIPTLKKEEKKLETLQSKLNDSKEKVELKRDLRDISSQKLQDQRVELVSLEGKQENLHYRIKASKESINEIDERSGTINDEISQLESKIKSIQSENKVAESNNKKIDIKLKKSMSVKNLKDDAFRETYVEIEQAEREIRVEHREREAKAEEIKTIELKIADYEGELRRVKEKIKDKYGIKIPSNVDSIYSEIELLNEIDSLERSLDRIGPINMAVEDEFGEENSRLGFLQRQQNDLVDSEDRLLKTMNEIDIAARSQFLETFENIQMNFKKTFSMFFEGGECDIELNIDDDPLDANINILAKPPGKHARNLRMLSSGEKALTAIALLFAIYLVKPSPFCILDEVDAPLDDNNVGKFTRVLEKFSEQTQFIIVTHNKLTMESAKYLYGVTMAQSGISKIVSVQLD